MKTSTEVTEQNNAKRKMGDSKKNNNCKATKLVQSNIITLNSSIVSLKWIIQTAEEQREKTQTEKMKQGEGEKI